MCARSRSMPRDRYTKCPMSNRCKHFSRLVAKTSEFDLMPCDMKMQVKDRTRVSATLPGRKSHMRLGGHIPGRTQTVT